MLIKQYFESLNGTKVLLWHFFIFLFVLLISLFANSPTFTLTLAGLLYTVYSVLVILGEKSKTRILLTPISVLFSYATISYGIAAIYMGLLGGRQNYVQFVNVYLDFNHIEKGYLVNLFGLFFLHSALEIFRPKHMILTKNAVQLKTLLILYLGGILVILSPSLASILGAFFVAFVPWLPVAVVLYIVFTDSKNLNITNGKKDLLIYGLTILLTGIQLFSLSKLSVLISIFPFIWYHLLKTKINHVFLLILGTVLLFYLFFIQPYITFARMFYYELPVDKLIVEFISNQETREILLSSNFEEIVSSGEDYTGAVETFLSRIFESTATAFIVKEVDDQGYIFGETMKSIAWGLIPRIIWQDKPDVAKGAWFTRYIGVDFSTAIGMTTAGELYWNFGYLGVAFGLFIIGMLYAGLWRMVGVYPPNSFLGVWLLLLVFNGMILHPEASGTFLGLFQMYIFFGLLYYLNNLFFGVRYQMQIVS